MDVSQALRRNEAWQKEASEAPGQRKLLFAREHVEVGATGAPRFAAISAIHADFYGVPMYFSSLAAFRAHMRGFPFSP